MFWLHTSLEVIVAFFLYAKDICCKTILWSKQPRKYTSDTQKMKDIKNVHFQPNKIIFFYKNHWYHCSNIRHCRNHTSHDQEIAMRSARQSEPLIIQFIRGNSVPLQNELTPPKLKPNWIYTTAKRQSGGPFPGTALRKFRLLNFLYPFFVYVSLPVWYWWIWVQKCIVYNTQMQ